MSYQWTTDNPTAGGLYWAFNGSEVVAVDLYFDGSPMPSSSRLIAFELGQHYDWAHELDEYTHWIGPLPVPEKP